MTDVLATLQDQSFARATAATASSYPPERRLNGGLADYLARRDDPDLACIDPLPSWVWYQDMAGQIE